MRQNLEYWQKLDNEEFVYVVRHINSGVLTRLDKDYISSRLKELGYQVEYGCCGRNMIRGFKYEG